MNDIKFGEKCNACIELEYALSEVCQCLQCDPDGTRYHCTCHEINKEEDKE